MLQNGIVWRRGQVRFDANDEFFISSTIEIHELGDDFVPVGSSGTASARSTKRKKAKGGGGANISKLVDVNLLKVQFTGKLQNHYKFCKEGMKQALAQAQEFRNTTSWLFKQYDDLVSGGIKEVAWHQWQNISFV